MDNLVTINSRKFDGSIHRSWQCELVEETKDYWIFYGEFDKEIFHTDLGHIKIGTISYEYYWKDQWFNVFRFHQPGGEFRNYYCNINMPPTFENGILDYIDLDLDILVWDDFKIELLDQVEFKQNSAKFNYSNELVLRSKNTVKQLLALIESRKFPFDFH